MSIVGALLIYFLPFGPAVYEILRVDLTDPAMDEDWGEDEAEAWETVPDLDVSALPPREVPAKPEPPAPPKPQKKKPKLPESTRAEPIPNATPAAPPEPEPPAPEVLTETPEPPETTEQPAEVAEAEAADDPEIQRFIEKRGPKVLRPSKRPNASPRKPKKPHGNDKSLPPCEPPTAEILPLEERHWEIKRDLVDYYTSHPFQFDDLAGVWTHRDKATGKADGFKIGLPRCSVLRQAGFKSGDVVNDVNGRTISTIPQAIAAYFAMNRKETFVVTITRKNERLTLVYEIPHRERKTKRHRQAEAASPPTTAVDSTPQ